MEIIALTSRPEGWLGVVLTVFLLVMIVVITFVLSGLGMWLKGEDKDGEDKD